MPDSTGTPAAERMAWVSSVGAGPSLTTIEYPYERPRGASTR
jgi:hypothetical protein